ncbi:MAG: PRC-barrel domain-containing protein [Opitutaceae bacterium]|nr:PRC-barrel domain-containing protein [Opitutaceae bacterium]
MKSPKQKKLATTSLTAAALCLMPLAGAQQNDETKRDDSQPAPHASSTTTPQSTSTSGASTDLTSSAASATDSTGAQDQQAAASSPQSNSTSQPSAAASDQQNTTQTAGVAAAATTDTQTSSSASKSDTIQSQPQVAATSAGNTSPQSVRVATREMREHTARKFAGGHVRGGDGKDLGKIKDFLIDSHSGKIEFGVVTSGGFAGIGDKMRLVPFAALQPSGEKDFKLSVDRAKWEQLPTVEQAQFDAGNVAMSDSEKRQLAQQFGGGSETSGNSEFYTSSISTHLVLASDLKGKEIHTGDKEVGTIEAIVIDQDSATASALIDPDNEFTKSDEKFLVPFAQLQIGGKKERIVSSLSAADFEPGKASATAATSTASSPTSSTTASTDTTAQGTTAQGTDQSGASTSVASADSTKSTTPTTSSGTQSGQSVASSSTPSSTSSEQVAGQTKKSSDSSVASSSTTTHADSALSPTGKTSADQIPANADPSLMAAARAVRQALDQDPSLAHLDVRVTPENGKLILRGSVEDEELARSVEKKAKSAASGQQVESQLNQDDAN